MSLSASASQRPLGAIFLGSEQGEPRTSFVVWAPRWIEAGVRVHAHTSSGKRIYVSLVHDADDPGFFVGEGPVPPGSLFEYQTAEGQSIGADPACMGYDKQRELSVVLDRRFVHKVRARIKRVLDALPTPDRVRLIAQVHLGTSGGFAGLAALSRYYKEMGYQALQTLPDSLFPGRFNAGYDVSSLFAVDPTYGTPQALAEHNATAAELGLVRVMDRVHNHIHPSNLLERFGPYFDGVPNEWGKGPTCDGPHAAAVRRYHREANRRWFEDLGYLGVRFDATFRVDDTLNRLLTADIDAIGESLGYEILTIAEDNHNDRRMTEGRSEKGSGFGFTCQYTPDKRHSALVIALLTTRQPITKHYLRRYVGLRDNEDASHIYAEELRYAQAFEQAFRIHVKALRQGMGVGHRRGDYDVVVDSPGKQPPWAAMALIEYHDGPQNNEAGQFIAAEMSAERTLTHYLAHAVGPEATLVFRGAEELLASKDRRFGWVADLSAVDKLNAAMGRHLDDLGGDHTIRPPWHSDFYKHKGGEVCYMVHPDGAQTGQEQTGRDQTRRLTWDDWRISWVIERAQAVADSRGTTEILRPDLLRAGEPVPEIDWDAYFSQTADSGFQLVDFSSQTALQAYAFDPQQANADQRVGREHFSKTIAAVAEHITDRDWHCMCVVAWDSLGVALMQRWDPHTGNSLVFIENLGPQPVAVTVTPDAARVNGEPGRVELLEKKTLEHERGYIGRWRLFRATDATEWGAEQDGERSTGDVPPAQFELYAQSAPVSFCLESGHAVVYFSCNP